VSEHPAVAFLEAELGRVEELARALPPGPWRWVEVDGEGGEYEALWGVDGKAVLASSDTEGCKSWVYRHDGLDACLPLVDPVSVLRRVAADRQILAECVHMMADGWQYSFMLGQFAEDIVQRLAESYGWVAP
jgi:hypothetical protein